MLHSLFTIWPFVLAALAAGVWGYFDWRRGGDFRSAQLRSIASGTLVGLISAVYVALVDGSLIGEGFFGVIDPLGRAVIISAVASFVGGLLGLVLADLLRGTNHPPRERDEPPG